MRNVFNIVKKELDKIFKNPRLIFSTFLLSPILLYVIYSTMGNIMTDEMKKSMSKPVTIEIVNVTEDDYNHSFYKAIKTYNESISASDYDLDKLNIKLTFYKDHVSLDDLSNEDSEVMKEINQTINKEKVDLWVYYDENFDQKLNNLATDVKNGVTDIEYPIVRYFINSYYTDSSTALARFETILNIQKGTFYQNLNVNPEIIDFEMQNDIISENQKAKQSLQAIAMLVPMLIVIFIFAGGMGIGADLIAGEKERGTIATLLMTPISKNEIVLGKIIAGIILTSISALCSAVGMLLSVGKLMGLSGGIKLEFLQVIELVIVVILLALLAISLFLAASTFASNIKEATMYIMPFYILGMVISILPMFSEHIPTGAIPYIIPVYNITLAIKGILIGELMGTQFLLIVLSTVVYFILILALVTRLFKSERIMFSK